MKYLFITNIPSPYRVRFFNALSKHLYIEVLFEGTKSQQTTFNYIDQASFEFKYHILNSKVYHEKKLNRKIKAFVLNKQYDTLIFMNYGYITELYGFFLARLHKRPYIIEIDGAFIKKESWIKRAIKTYVFQQAKAILSPGTFTDDYFKHYGYQGPIYRYTFTSLEEKDIINNDHENHYPNKKTWLYVGRWVSWKGYQDVLEVSKHFKEDAFMIITQFDQIPNLEILQKEYPNVIFKDFMSSEELYEHMKSSFALLLPTTNDIWGLVVNEALSCGLPVITTNRCGAGLSLIEHGFNGFIYSYNDSKLMIKYMHKLNDKDTYEKLSKHALMKIKENTISTMVEDHITILNELEKEG
jgi:glycosyltransferase involved in cell wall biosynthesis